VKTTQRHALRFIVVAEIITSGLARSTDGGGGGGGCDGRAR